MYQAVFSKLRSNIFFHNCLPYLPSRPSLPSLIPLAYLPVTPLSPPFSFSSSSQFPRLNFSHQFITSPVLFSPSLILSPSPSTTLTAPSLTPFILFPTFFHLSPSSSLSPSPSPSPSLTDSLPYFLHPLTHLLSSLSLIFPHPFTFSRPLTFYHPLPYINLVPFFTFFSSPPSLFPSLMPLPQLSSISLTSLTFPHPLLHLPSFLSFIFLYPSPSPSSSISRLPSSLAFSHIPPTPFPLSHLSSIIHLIIIRPYTLLDRKTNHP